MRDRAVAAELWPRLSTRAAAFCVHGAEAWPPGAVWFRYDALRRCASMNLDNPRDKDE
jgi:hypothetical protein